jgi:hypothetical protein
MRPETPRIRSEGRAVGIEEALNCIGCCVELKHKFTSTFVERVELWTRRGRFVYTEEIRRLNQRENYKRGIIDGRQYIAEALRQVYRQNMPPKENTITHNDLKQVKELL